MNEIPAYTVKFRTFRKSFDTSYNIVNVSKISRNNAALLFFPCFLESKKNETKIFTKFKQKPVFCFDPKCLF